MDKNFNQQKNVNKRNNPKKIRYEWHKNTNGENMMLIPQYNKFITINNSNFIPPTIPIPKYNENIVNKPKEDEINKHREDVINKPKISRIIIKKPSDITSNSIENDDSIFTSILEKIFAGTSTNGFTFEPLDNDKYSKAKLNNPNLNNPNLNKDEIIIPKINYESMKFIDEIPTSIEDLILIIEKIGKEYDINQYYNLDITKLKNIKNHLVKLSNMIGLIEIKSKIVDIILYYLQRLDIKNYDLLHTIIDGSPGTGKSEIAHIYGEILAGLGILSKNIFKTIKKHDVIGGYLGHTAIKTMKLLDEVKGGVLFIDEIYSFGSSDGKEGKDIYAKEFVDLLMQYMTENKGDFVLVVAGYKNDIKKFFLTMNDGLERRFPIQLSIGDYSPIEMYKIFLKKIDDFKWQINNKQDDDYYIHFFETNKEYFKYFGGDIEVFLTKCKYAHSRNLLNDHNKVHRIITKDDFINGFKLFIENPEIKERKGTNKLSYFI